MLLFIGSSFAAPISVDSVFHFRDITGFNHAGLIAGDRLAFGAGLVVPNGSAGTIGTATQGDTAVPLQFQGTTVSPDLLSNSIGYRADRTGAWQLDFANGPDTTTVSTAAVGTVGQMPFATNLMMTAGGTNPTFTWEIPAGVSHDAIRIAILDLEVTRGGGTGTGADVVHAQGLQASATSFTVPDTFSNLGGGATGAHLVLGHRYSLEIDLVDTRDNTGNVTFSNRLSRSRIFHDFTPLPATEIFPVALPTLGADPITCVPPACNVPFLFNTPVAPGIPVRIDPFFAIGYDYQIGAGDPNFQSVMLPTGFGDNLYDLFLFDTGLGDWVDTGLDLTGGAVHDFGAGGVDRFRILGIGTDAELDPGDTTAFITTLTFTDDGRFTGTMTPITEFVPVPGSLALLGLGLGLLGLSRRRIH